LSAAHAAFFGDKLSYWTAQRRGHACRSSSSPLALFPLDEASSERSLSLSSHQILSVAEASDQYTTTRTTTDALSSQDIGVGIIMALLLAALASFLQGQSSTSSFPNFVLWLRDNNDNDEGKDTPAAVGNASLVPLPASNDNYDVNNAIIMLQPRSNTILFNATNWKEMSRPENYIWYSNPNLRANIKRPKVQKSKFAKNDQKNRLALFALVILFIPIFGAELFLALSRQFLCDGWAPDFCAPIYKG
jgi:hypothetical protein